MTFALLWFVSRALRALAGDAQGDYDEEDGSAASSALPSRRLPSAPSPALPSRPLPRPSAARVPAASAQATAGSAGSTAARARPETPNATPPGKTNSLHHTILQT